MHSGAPALVSHVRIASGGLVVQWTVVESVDTVLLGLGGRRQVEHNHLQDSLSGGKPLLHDTLQELLADEFLFVALQLHVDGLEHLLDLPVLLGHDGFEETW